MKDPAFFSSPVYPPIIPTKPQLSTNRNEYLTPILSTNRFSFKSKLTSFYMHPTDYTFKLYDKNQDFFTSIASKIMAPYQYWLDNSAKIFSLRFDFFRPSIYDLKTDEIDPSCLSNARKATHYFTHLYSLSSTHQTSKLHFCELQIYIAFHDDKFIHH